MDNKSEAKKGHESAVKQAEKLTPAVWQKAYPGNNPAIAKEALRKMVDSIEFNLNLTRRGVDN